MAVSTNWRNLRDYLRKTHNREVNEWFRDVPDEFPDNSTSRKQAKRACLILPSDSQNIALVKMINFRFIVQRVHLNPHVFAPPNGNSDPIRKHRPIIKLHFLEAENENDKDCRKVEGTISYRLINESSTTITKNKLIVIANRMKEVFGGDNTFIWEKGKVMASYTDKSNGYQFQLLVRSENNAEKLITKVLATNSDRPDWKYLSYKTPDQPEAAYPKTTENINILGKTFKKPRRRPTADVRFQYAYCHISGLSNPILLYDRSLRPLNPLVK